MCHVTCMSSSPRLDRFGAAPRGPSVRSSTLITSIDSVRHVVRRRPHSRIRPPHIPDATRHVARPCSGAHIGDPDLYAACHLLCMEITMCANSKCPERSGRLIKMCPPRAVSFGRDRIARGPSIVIPYCSISRSIGRRPRACPRTYKPTRRGA